MNMGQGRTYVAGKRLKRKEIREGGVLVSAVEYTYKYGVLTNPSVHTTTKYTPLYMVNDGIRLVASQYNTMDPQNSDGGVPVSYGVVEERFLSASGISNGKKVYHYEGVAGILPNNYIVLNNSSTRTNHLINIPNTLGGTQTYHSPHSQIQVLSNSYGAYLTYPIPRITDTDYSRGTLIKEETYDKDGIKIRQIENTYSYNHGDQQYGYKVEKYDDTNIAPSSSLGVLTRYEVSILPTINGMQQLRKRITTDYHTSGPVVKEENFLFNQKNLLTGISVTDSKGLVRATETRYVGDVSQATHSNLSIHAAALQSMKSKNMIGIPVQRLVQRGASYVEGSYTAFRQLPGGKVVVDSTFRLQPSLSTNVSAPRRVQRSSAFTGDLSFPTYDEYASPVTVVSKDGVSETVIRGYDGYVIARFNNYSYAKVQSNSSLLAQLSLLKNYRIIDPSNRSSLAIVNQAIRQSLPIGVFVTTYTYNPHVGQTSVCDARGLVVFYSYDALNRLNLVSDGEGNIIKQYCYNYAGNVQDCSGTSGTGVTTIYVKMELFNPQEVSGTGWRINLVDVRYALYSDSTCTEPYSPTVPLTINNGSKNIHYYAGGHTPPTEVLQPSYVNFAVGINEVIFSQMEQYLSIDNGVDPILGPLYDVYITEYLLFPGTGYQVAL